MNIFDIIGPVMVGPSSSHTAGAVKIGRIARTLLGEEPSEAVIKLHGSFAKTYKGHGTVKALIGGLLGMMQDDLRIVNSLEIAQEKGLKHSLEKIELKDVHPNSTVIEAVGKSGGKINILASSTGGGNIVVRKFNGLDVEFKGAYTTLIVLHKDVPGAVASVAKLLADREVNIAHMRVIRAYRGGKAMMVIETDQPVKKDLGDIITNIPNICGVTIVEPL